MFYVYLIFFIWFFFCPNFRGSFESEQSDDVTCLRVPCFSKQPAISDSNLLHSLTNMCVMICTGNRPPASLFDWFITSCIKKKNPNGSQLLRILESLFYNIFYWAQFFYYLCEVRFNVVESVIQTKEIYNHKFQNLDSDYLMSLCLAAPEKNGSNSSCLLSKDEYSGLLCHEAHTVSTRPQILYT